MRRIAILGSTGSIGTQAVDVVRRLTGNIRAGSLSAHRNGDLLLEQAVSLGVETACLSDPEAAHRFADRFRGEGIRLLSGKEGLVQLLDEAPVELVLNSLVGSAGLAPTLETLKRGIPLALANKESLVAGGDLVIRTAREQGAQIIPVDSEHSAVFQCLAGERRASLERILLTASGGPFRDSDRDELERVTVDDALSHPTWSMGPKVTIDSATLMNKGLEVLEAHHLFGVELERIDIVIHPQSVIHSMVELVDGSVLAQMGVPDMRIPIQYALTYPERAVSPSERLDLAEYGALTFLEPDPARFPCLKLAYRSGTLGRNYPSAMNAANEEAVAAFLDRRIRFTEIPMVVEGTMEKHQPGDPGRLEEILEAESAARAVAGRIIGGMEETR